jgi:hypothetical protein
MLSDSSCLRNGTVCFCIDLFSLSSVYF